MPRTSSPKLPRACRRSSSFCCEHQLGLADLGGAGGKVAVPEERRLLQQRRRRVPHPVQPPAGQQLGIVRRERDLGELSHFVVKRGVCAASARRVSSSRLTARLRADPHRLVQLAGIGRKAGPAIQMAAKRRSKGCSADGSKGSQASSGARLASVSVMHFSPHYLLPARRISAEAPTLPSATDEPATSLRTSCSARNNPSISLFGSGPVVPLLEHVLGD